MMEQRRIFSASDLAQFEYCPLAWWYEEVSELAQADEEELTQRLKELEDEYESSAPALPEYQVIERLIERANLFAQGREQRRAERQANQADKSAVVTPVPRIFMVIVAGLVVLTLVLLGLGLLLWLQ
ncbi:MAG TPA: hypothetical protein VH599_11660 [Ktedonobacterales bacterium]|jgi:hypothetical protein